MQIKILRLFSYKKVGYLLIPTTMVLTLMDATISGATVFNTCELEEVVSRRQSVTGEANLPLSHG